LPDFHPIDLNQFYYTDLMTCIAVSDDQVSVADFIVGPMPYDRRGAEQEDCADSPSHPSRKSKSPKQPRSPRHERGHEIEPAELAPGRITGPMNGSIRVVCRLQIFYLSTIYFIFAMHCA
jgi:hypothetical protein